MIITKFKIFEQFYSDEYIDSLIDKIGDEGINSLSSSERKILDSKSKDHKDIYEIIDRIKSLNSDLEIVTNKMAKNKENKEESLKIFKNEFAPISHEMYNLADELEYTYKIDDNELEILLGFKL